MNFEFVFGKSHTCPHCIPSDTPTPRCVARIRFEHQVDDVAYAGDIGWQGRRATGFPHQGGPVSICDIQVVVITGGLALGLEVSEL